MRGQRQGERAEGRIVVLRPGRTPSALSSPVVLLAWVSRAVPPPPLPRRFCAVIGLGLRTLRLEAMLSTLRTLQQGGGPAELEHQAAALSGWV